VVFALPHMGNYDLAGAWVIAKGAGSVTTVAERVKPESAPRQVVNTSPVSCQPSPAASRSPAWLPDQARSAWTAAAGRARVRRDRLWLRKQISHDRMHSHEPDGGHSSAEMRALPAGIFMCHLAYYLWFGRRGGAQTASFAFS